MKEIYIVNIREVVRFQCPECDWEGTDQTALDEEEVMDLLEEAEEDDKELLGIDSEYMEGDSDTRTGEIFDNYYK